MNESLNASVGTALAQVAYGAAQRAAGELVASGTFGAFEGGADFVEMNALFRR